MSEKWLLEDRIWTVKEETKVREAISDWDELSVVFLTRETHGLTFYRIALRSGAWRRVLWTTLFEDAAREDYKKLIESIEILDEGEDV